MNEFQAQTTTECLSTWCGLKVDHTEPHNDVRVERSASRVEAAAWVYGDEIGDCSSYDAMLGALAAADAHDAAHEVHRLELTEATVERAARTHFERINNGYPWAAQSDSMKDMYRRDIRAVLAAAVEAGQ